MNESLIFCLFDILMFLHLLCHTYTLISFKKAGQKMSFIMAYYSYIELLFSDIKEQRVHFLVQIQLWREQDNVLIKDCLEKAIR